MVLRSAPALDRVNDLASGVGISGVPEAISEGSDHWTWQVGDWIVRFPRNDEVAERLANEAVLMPSVAPALSLPVPCEYRIGDGFVAHRMLQGVSAEEFRPPSDSWPVMAASLG